MRGQRREPRSLLSRNALTLPHGNCNCNYNCNYNCNCNCNCKVHRHAGILSAYGLALADVVTEAQEPCALRIGSAPPLPVDRRDADVAQAEAEYKPGAARVVNEREEEEAAVAVAAGGDAAAAAEVEAAAAAAGEVLLARFAELEGRAKAELLGQGFAEAAVRSERLLNLRFEGTDAAIMITVDAIDEAGADGAGAGGGGSGSAAELVAAFLDAFVARYQVSE